MRRPGRIVLAVGVAAVGIMGVLTATTPGPVPGSSTGPGGPAATAPSPPPTPERARPAVTDGIPSFTASPSDVDRPAKEAAARFVERVGSWNAMTPADPGARIASAGYPAALAAVAAPLLDDPARTATTSIVYPQYGGLTGTSASVIVLARQVLEAGSDSERSREVLLDLRLRRGSEGVWEVTSIVDPARPPAPPGRSGGPTELGRAVLDNPRLRIPAPGRADIVARRVGDPLLATLDALARTHTLDVQVLVTGHPGVVFPTEKVSNHAVGRAADVRAVDGLRVVDVPRDAPLRELMIAAGRAGATEVGGPIPIAGRGFLTDAVHQDHLHIGITPTKPSASPAPA